MEVSYAGALIAGLLSFLSPCVLPLVPPYLAFLGGVTAEAAAGEDDAGLASMRVFAASVAFVIGFSIVFVAMGATASAISGLIARYADVLAVVAGAVIVLLGLHFLGIFKAFFLYRELRFHPERRPAGLLGAGLVGMAFAFGWTPCVGPVLAAILFTAASDESVFYGASLLGTYALGIGIPFLLAAAFVRPFLRFARGFGRWLGVVAKVIGALLVATGILFMTGGMSEIAYWLLETFPALGRVG